MSPSICSRSGISRLGGYPWSRCTSCVCCFLLASSPLRPPPAPGIVNCLIDKITTASYMHRISLTLPRFPPTALPPLCPVLLREASRGPLWKPAFAYRYRDRPLLIDRRLDRLTDHSSLLFLCFAALQHWKVFGPRIRSRGKLCYVSRTMLSRLFYAQNIFALISWELIICKERRGKMEQTTFSELFHSKRIYDKCFCTFEIKKRKEKIVFRK